MNELRCSSRQPSRNKLCNPGLEQEKSKMARRRKKMDLDCFRPLDWLSSMELRKLPFFPQIGDEVMYFRQGHELYLNIIKQKKLYDINPISLPWSKQMIHQQELVRIIDVKYEIKPPRLVSLTLGRLDPRKGALTKKRFIIRYHDMDEVPDFLILKQDYDAAIKRQWNSTQRFRCLMNDDCRVQMWWEGQFVKREPFNPQFPESMFLCYLIRWDNGDFDRLSPWDLENIDSTRQPLRVGASVAVLPIEIMRASYVPGIEDWPPVGDRDSESDRISAGISEVMALDIAMHFSAPVDLDKFPAYASVVKYPMDLRTIKTRLDNRFYRRVAAVEYDVRRIHTNALLFNDPTKSNIVKNSCIITDLCLEIIRKVDAELSALSLHFFERCKTKEVRGNVKSSETSNPIQGSSEPPPQDSPFKRLKKQLPQTDRPSDEISFPFAINIVVSESNQTSVPTLTAKEHWPTEVSSSSSKGQISPKFSSFMNVDGAKTGIGLTGEVQKYDDDSKRENTRCVPGNTTSRMRKKPIDPEEVKDDRKLKPTASITPYTVRCNDELAAINSEDKDVSAHVDQYALPIAQNTSRRSRLPIYGVGREHLDGILLPESTLSFFPTVSPAVSTGVRSFNGLKNNSDSYFGDKICYPPSDVTVASSITMQTINLARVSIGHSPKQKKTSTSCDRLSNRSRELTRSPVPTFSSLNPGMEILAPPTDSSHFQLCTLNTPLDLKRIRKKEYSSNTCSGISNWSIPVPLAVSTPIGVGKKKGVSETNFELGKPCSSRKENENEVTGQSVSFSRLSVNPCGGKMKNKRLLSRLSLWDVSLVEREAQRSSGQESTILQEKSLQRPHRNQLPMLEMVTKDRYPQLNTPNRKIEETLSPVCGTSANMCQLPEVKTASLISLQKESLDSVMMGAPSPVRSAKRQPKSANGFVFKENRNQAPSAAEDKLLAKGHDNQADEGSNPTSSNCFSLRPYEVCEAPESLLKKTLKKEHQAKWLTCKTRTGNERDNSCVADDEKGSDAAGLKVRSDPVSRSQDVLIAEILAESNIRVPMDVFDSGRPENKPRKGNLAGIPALSKVKKRRVEPVNVCGSVREVMKKCVGNKSSHEQPDDSKKREMKHPKASKKKRIDKLVSKGALVYQHDVENVGDVSSNLAASGKKQNRTRKVTHAKYPSINEQLALVDRILLERK